MCGCRAWDGCRKETQTLSGKRRVLAGWGHPVKHPPLWAPGRIQWLSGPGWGPVGAGDGAELCEWLGETPHPLCMELC